MTALYFRTPVIPPPGFAGASLKLENLQPTGSYKVRGFAAAASALPDDVRARGLLTVSAGNAAAACAWVAHQLGAPCRVVMVDSAPAPKVDAVRRWGASPVFMPRAEMFEWMARRGWEEEPEAGGMIHPHTNPVLASAAGHGTLVAELVEQVPNLRRLVVPVGGGGLVIGVADAVRKLGLAGRLEVVGVMAGGYPLWPAAIAAGGDPKLTPATMADGTAAPFNPEVFPRVTAAVDRWLVVPEHAVAAAMAALARDAKVVAEGAGALAFAALGMLPAGEAGGAAALVTGGNVAPGVLAELLGG